MTTDSDDKPLDIFATMKTTLAFAARIDRDPLATADARLLARMVAVLATVCGVQERRLVVLEADGRHV